MSFNRSTVVITGASRGIGREIALQFAGQSEHSLLLIARNRALLESVAQECSKAGCRTIEVAVCDLSDPSEIENLSLPRVLAPPAILINNAGSFLHKPLEETSEEEFTMQWKLHALAPFLLTKKLLPVFRKQKRALIVNISSTGALKGEAESGAYAASKHALLGFSRSLRLELRQSPVAVTTINLGQTYSTSWEGIDVDPESLIDPADVGRITLQLTRLSPRSVAEEIMIYPQTGARRPD